jgi:hypothetical protein
MTIFENQNPFHTNNVEFLNGKILNYEKGTSNNEMRHIDYGITYFRKSAFSAWADQSSFDLSKVCHELAKAGQLDGFEVFENFYEVGSTKGIEEFSRYLREVPSEL